MLPVRLISVQVAAAAAIALTAAWSPCVTATPTAHSTVYLQAPLKCLTDDVKLTEIVNETGRKTPRTVAKKLHSLHARCRKGKLVDRRRREIRFFRLQGCWGNPPVNYGDILARQNEEIADLRKKYTVIELSCNPDGGPVQ